jgi:hypothetical protein
MISSVPAASSGQSTFLQSLSGNTCSDERESLTGDRRIRQALIIEGGEDASRNSSQRPSPTNSRHRPTYRSSS